MTTLKDVVQEKFGGKIKFRSDLGEEEQVEEEGVVEEEETEEEEVVEEESL